MAVAPILPSDDWFGEIIDFLASGPTSEAIIDFKPSDRLDQRLHYLLDQNKLERLTLEERRELDDFMRMNHFMNMLKIRVRQKLAES